MKWIVSARVLVPSILVAACSAPGGPGLPATISIPTLPPILSLGPAIPIPSSTPTPSPSPALSATPMPPEAPLYTAFPTLGPLITRTLAPPAECPPPGNPAPIEGSGDASVLAEEIERFLDDGGSPTALRSSLELATAALAGPDQRFHTYIESVDVTGDATADVIVSLGRLPGNPDYGGGVLVWRCRQGGYDLVFKDGVFNPMAFSEVIYVATADLNAYGPPELLYAVLESNVEAAGIWSYLVVVEWEQDAFRWLVSPPQEEGQFYRRPAAVLWDLNEIGSVPISELREEDDTRDPGSLFSDVNGDGTLEFVLKGPGGAYLWPFGVGNEYDHFDTWGWNGEAFTLWQVTVQPSFYRVQAVVKGDKAFGEGDFKRAVEFYQYETNFGFSAEEHGHPFYEEPAPEVASSHPLTAYAQFRAIVAYTALGSTEDVVRIRNRMALDFYKGTADHAYVETAERFIAEYARTGDLQAACLAAQVNVGFPTKVLMPLKVGPYGEFFFKDYSGNDICPAY